MKQALRSHRILRLLFWEVTIKTLHECVTAAALRASAGCAATGRYAAAGNYMAEEPFCAYIPPVAVG